MTPIQRNKPGFHFNLELAKTTFAEASINGRIALRNPLAISMILRVLRFLDNSVKDQWLQDLLLFSESNRKCVALLASLPDWQACLFLLISETVENVVSSRKDPKSFDENAGLANSQSPQIESAILDASFGADLLHTRLDRCLKLYSTLLGHLVREGGEHVSFIVECLSNLFIVIESHSNSNYFILRRWRQSREQHPLREPVSMATTFCYWFWVVFVAIFLSMEVFLKLAHCLPKTGKMSI